MRLLYLLLFLVVMMGSSVFAQSTNLDPNDMDFAPSWNQNFDSTTEWGKWLVNIVKPYLDKCNVAKKNLEERVTSDVQALPANTTAAENTKVIVNARNEYCKEIENIVPPAELSVFHSKFLDLNCKYTFGEYLKDKDLLRKGVSLSLEAKTEFKEILAKYNVPQKVIDGFINKHKQTTGIKTSNPN